MRRSGILDDGTNYEQRLMTIEEAAKWAEHAKGMGHKIVATSGSFDLAHIGHFKYLEVARSKGDFLVVGVDSDEKIRHSKGPDRPVVAQDERMHMLAHLRHVDVLVLKNLNDPPQNFIKMIRPDVLVLSKRNNTKPEKIESLREFCGEVVELESQAVTSTTARVRLLIIGRLRDYVKDAKASLDRLLEDMHGKDG
jgi:rfaE bifunctional protein nucleotidyltransferase chain/domain